MIRRNRKDLIKTEESFIDQNDHDYDWTPDEQAPAEDSNNNHQEDAESEVVER